MTIVLLGIIIVLLVILLLGLGAQIGFSKREADLWIQLAKTLKVVAEARAANHLEVMKALKGQSYAGKFGEFDIHTDPNIPPGAGPVLFP